MHAGETIRAYCKEQRVEINDEVAAPTTPKTETTAAPASSALGAMPPASDDHDAVTEEGVSSGPSPSNGPAWRELAAAGKYRRALEAAERGGFERECERASAEDLVALGDAARFAGQPARAVQALQALRKRFPSDPRSGAAAFELGRVAFDQQASFGEAAKWFAIYLRERPHGSLAREASGRLMESLSKAGDNAGARDAAAKYLARYPSGPHSELARKLVGP
jgi:TolA-binding protein